MSFIFYIISLGVFIQGISEFMIAGIGPTIAQSLDVPISATGTLTSAFALGMVFGAPLMASLVRTWQRKFSLTMFLFIFALSHALAAENRSFMLIFITRIISAGANAGFLAIALLIATEESYRHKHAISLIMSGATLACALGAPFSSLLNTFLGWRIVFLIISLISFIISIGLAISDFPAQENTLREAESYLQGPSIFSEIKALANKEVLRYMISSTLVNGATFCGFTYFLTILRYNSHFMGKYSGTGLLLLFGVGAFIGVKLSGRFLESHEKTMILLGSALLIGWLLMVLDYRQHFLMVFLLFIQGTLSFLIGTILITRILKSVIGVAPSLAGAYSTLALNLGAAIGPLLGGILIGFSEDFYLALWCCVGSIALYLLGTLTVQIMHFT